MEISMEDEDDHQAFSDLERSDSQSDDDFEGHGGGNGTGSIKESQKTLNVAALVRGNLVVKRQSLLPRVLSVPSGAVVARRPFKSPCLGSYSDHNQHLQRRLWARKRFVPWGSSQSDIVGTTNFSIQSKLTENEVQEEDEDMNLPPGVEPLVLWQPEETGDETKKSQPIVVEPLLLRFLRPHQREGVQFMFDCVSGLHSTDNICGCILADDMGLGKTLQSITLLYTLLRQGFDRRPMVKKAIIVTPTSLVSNWEAEIEKWVGDRVQLIALCESSRDDVVSGIDKFISPYSKFEVLIVSYETFRIHSSKFSQTGSCDLLVCDEAHRLKNDQTITNRALAVLSCKRRILLSGTPMQNDLEEFYALVNFTNPGILGDGAHFRRYYEVPIICGREPNASEEEKVLSGERSAELSAKVNQFILRRTNTLLSNHLPPKIIEVVCCKLTPLQSELYNYFIQSKNVKRAIIEEKKQSKILAYITALKKLCNHPKLIYDTIRSGKPGTSGLEGCMQFFPPELFSGRSGAWTGGNGVWVELSGKMHVLARLLAHLRKKTDDRIVLVSNYTQTLDLFAQLCRERRYPFLRLDGTISVAKRQKLVNRFNDQSKDEFVFLLSSKAGGCGLNLIGGNRLVLFDPDWNPANDKQAAARVWRDGQKKRVYIYRFLSSGTIEEKVYQRQMSKEGLQKVIQHEQGDCNKGNFMSMEDLHDLFSFRDNVRYCSLPNWLKQMVPCKVELESKQMRKNNRDRSMEKQELLANGSYTKFARISFFRSEIHEKMTCVRCRQNEDEGMKVQDGLQLMNEACVSGQEKADVGGFAELAECFHSLKDSERQVGSPLEEDLCNWGHHTSSSSVPDVIFQASAGDEVTFVFTNQVDGKLVPKESMLPKTTIAREESPSLNLKENISPRGVMLSSGDLAAAPACSEKAAVKKNSSSATSLMHIKSLRGTRHQSSVFGSQLPFKRPKPTLNDGDDDDFQ